VCTDVDMTDAPGADPSLPMSSLEGALSPKPAALAQNINNWEDDLSHPTIK